MKIVLLGYMGSGKSAVGIELSTVMKLPFIDLDTYIQEKEEKSITSIFQEKGEIYFRKIEAKYLTQILQQKESCVIATGGGTPCYGSVMQDLTKNLDVLTIYLNTSVAVLTNRLWDEREQRPLIAHINNKEVLNDFIRKHLFERAFYYNQAAVVINCEELDVREITEKVLLQLF